MSNQYLKLRRSNIEGKIPTTESIDFGEIALNTFDGKAYMKKSGSSGIEIVEIGAGTSITPSSYITTGSITASVDINPNELFLIKSGSTVYHQISSNGNTDIYSNLFIIKNKTTQQPVFTVSQSIVQFATQSSSPSGIAPNGGVWFTSTDFYVGLD